MYVCHLIQFSLENSVNCYRISFKIVCKKKLFNVCKGCKIKQYLINSTHIKTLILIPMYKICYEFAINNNSKLI